MFLIMEPSRNTFPFCGLLDVLIRFGIETTSLYGDIRSTFPKVKDLLDSLNILTEILFRLRERVGQYEQSSSTRINGCQLPHQVQVALHEYQHLLIGLRLFMESFPGKPKQRRLEGHLHLMRWETWSEKLKACCAKVEQQMTTFLVLLPQLRTTNAGTTKSAPETYGRAFQHSSTTSLSIEMPVTPTRDWSTESAHVHLMNQWQPVFPAPRIGRLLHVWIRKRSMRADLRSCLVRDDVDGFRRLLGNGKVSIFDKSKGYRLLDVSRAQI